jgi:hypothetical protein
MEREMRFIGRGRGAKFQASVLLLAIAGLGSLSLSGSTRQSAATAKEDSPDLKFFVGTWKASFKGTVFATLILKRARRQG